MVRSVYVFNVGNPVYGEKYLLSPVECTDIDNSMTDITFSYDIAYSCSDIGNSTIDIDRNK